MPISTASDVTGAAALLADAPSPVVVVPIHDAYEDAVRCIEAIGAHTDPRFAVLIVDDGGGDRRLVELLERVADRVRQPVVILVHPMNQGFVRSCNDAFEATGRRDVIIVNSDVIVGPEWLSRLTAAAESADVVATATTMTNHGAIVSIPHRNVSVGGLPQGMTPDEAARRVAAASLQLRPTIPTGVGHCCYIRRAALDLVGPFDRAFEPGYGEEVDFCQRAVAYGFRHVMADDVFTFHRGGGSFGTSPAVTELRHRHELLVRRRHPWYEWAMRRAAEDPASPLADAIATGRRALLGLTVGVDGLILGPNKMGTQETVVQTVRALSRRPEIARLVVFTPHRLPAYVVALREELPDVEFIGVNPFVDVPERVVDVVYRPCQVNDISELNFIARAGERFVVNQLDTIAFGNPAYAADGDEWAAYRDLTRLTMQLANGVAFLSERGRESVVVEGLLPSGVPSAVVSCGVDGVTDDIAEDELDRHCPPPLTAADDGFLLCIGASYLHKNRPFVVDVWAELVRRGWRGRLVLAGPAPPHGNSLAREAEVLLGHPELRSQLVMLDAVTEGQKQWLYRRAALVLYPSTVEGFGLVPFEAARHGVATLASRRASLDEVLPAGIPFIDGFDVTAAADVAWTLLHDPVASAALVEALRARSADFTWDGTAERLLRLFEAALRSPRGRVLAMAGERDVPIGLRARSGSGAPRTSSSVERLVGAVIGRPALKHALSPDGSRRQRAARVVISGVRRRAP